MPKGIKQTHIHLISNVDPFLKKGDCKHCGRVHLIKRWRRGGWFGEWSCANKTYEMKNAYRRRKYQTAEGRLYVRMEKYKRGQAHRLHVKPYCQRCGFVAKHICQIDVHHRDGDHYNNNPENLESICSNCHRLEHASKTADEMGLFLTPVIDYQI